MSKPRRQIGTPLLPDCEPHRVDGYCLVCWPGLFSKALYEFHATRHYIKALQKMKKEGIPSCLLGSQPQPAQQEANKHMSYYAVPFRQRLRN